MAIKPRILIVGAGIGGLTAAIALRRVGMGVEVFERAAELKEIGAGIVLSANAMRVLQHLGLMQQVVNRGTVIKAAVGSTSSGVTLLTALFAFVGYLVSRCRGQSPSIVYALCPALLFCAFLCVLFIRDIIHAFSS